MRSMPARFTAHRLTAWLAISAMLWTAFMPQGHGGSTLLGLPGSDVCKAQKAWTSDEGLPPTKDSPARDAGSHHCPLCFSHLPFLGAPPRMAWTPAPRAPRMASFAPVATRRAAVPPRWEQTQPRAPPHLA